MLAAVSAKKDCVAGYVAEALSPVVGGAPPVTLTLAINAASPKCDKFVLSADGSTVTNVKVADLSIAGTLQFLNEGAAGVVSITPVFSKAATPTTLIQSIPAGGAQIVSVTDTLQLETGETATFQISATGDGAVFIVAGGVSFSRINEAVDG
jgi:hypothetical protein